MKTKPALRRRCKICRVFVRAEFLDEKDLCESCVDQLEITDLLEAEQ